MKAKQVIKLLGITRPTLTKYIKLGKLKVTPLPNNFYDYDEESVYTLLNKGITRKSVIYCRVSTQKQKKVQFGRLQYSRDSYGALFKSIRTYIFWKHLKKENCLLWKHYQ